MAEARANRSLETSDKRINRAFPKKTQTKELTELVA
jgi:hypothetical protein